MAEARRLAAIDLGAESGRVVVGRFDGERATLDVVHRFDNRPLWLPDGLHWNVPGLFDETLHGLAVAARDGSLDGIGIDSWGCDYALLDAGNRMLGLPFHYRDERTDADVVSQTHACVGRDELYRRTGIQTLAINTIFQLRTEVGGAAASVCERIALIPDLLGLWLTGALANEVTVASTTGLLEADGRRWACDLAHRLELPSAPFTGEVVQAGFVLGPVLRHHRERAGQATGAPVQAVAGHDTASAFAAAPIAGAHAAVLSSGTWSLLGVELDEPQLGEDAAALNMTNERGVQGTVRLLRNVMGLWLLQACRRAWRAGGVERGYDELHELAARARPDVALFDPDDDSLLRGDDMPARITGLLRDGGQRVPEDEGGLIRSILMSLACKYRLVLEQLETVTGRSIETVHVVGGGARNTLLCQLTADVTGREILAGPVEATALGNILVQALGLGELSSLAQLRAVAARSISVERYEPSRSQHSEEIYHRFLMATGSATDRVARSTV